MLKCRERGGRTACPRAEGTLYWESCFKRWMRSILQRKGAFLPSSPLAKLYYSIGEVSQLTGVEPHVLRYWESEFRELSPRKNRGGKRLYRDGDIALVQKIKELLYERRYTIEGARRYLREATVKQNARPVPVHAAMAGEIREGLLELRRMIDER